MNPVKSGKINPMEIYEQGLAQISEYSDKASKIIDDLIDKVINEPSNSEIAHYTNDLGLAGILGSGSLRCTNIFDLNDPTEIEHGFAQAIKVFNNLSINGSPLEKDFVQKFCNLYQAKLKGTANYYVCSFSTECDDLGQWRSYADNGRGYALIFDKAALEDYFTKLAPGAKDHNSTFDIRYNDNEIGQIQSQLVHGAFNLISYLEHHRSIITNTQFASYLKDLSTKSSAHIIHASLFYKHEAYRHEKEFRFLQIFRGDLPTPDIKIRTRNYQSVEYREFDWSPSNALKKIVIGPSANIQNAESFAKEQLSLLGLNHVQIEHSKIPYKVF